MFSTKFVAAAAASFSLIRSSAAVYDPSSQRNLAMYWGSGYAQLDLAHFCDQAAVDVIPIGFINIFPPAANGLVAETFGNQCWNGNYTGPGYDGVNNPADNFLYEQCPNLQRDLYYCQTQTNKKILLSLGGAAGDYYLNGVEDGKYLAEFLWGAYGPYNKSWTGVRPLDRGYYNTNLTQHIDFDGFDFDIEQSTPDQQAGYVACINRLRELFAINKAKNPCAKDYIISGAPQCPLDEPYMSTAIEQAKFDILWIQFYNNGQNGCTARNYVDNTAAKKPSGFNYDSWVTKVNAGNSTGAKLYIGLLAGQAGSTGSPNDYINAADAKTLITQYHSHAQFGGVMLYEATVAENNNQFYNQIKNVLNSVAAAGTGVTSTVCSTTVSSTSSVMTSTSSTSTKASSTSVSSTSSKATSTSVSSTSSKASSSSSTQTTSSSSSTLSSSTSSSILSSSTSASSSSSSIASSSSIVSSSSVISSTSSTTPSATPTPTTVPSVGTCSWIGCYSEATSTRALSGAVYDNYTLMSVEICSSFCKGFAYFGVEYGGECYCGDSFGAGSVVKPTIDCSMTCDGTPTELCGGSDRLDVYQCGAGTSSSSSSSVGSSSSSTASAFSSTISLSSSSSSASSTLSSSSSMVSSSASSSLSSSSVVSTSSASSTAVSSSSSSSVVPTSSVVSSSSSSVIPTSTLSSSASSSVVSSSSLSSLSSSSVSPTLTSTSSSMIPTSSSYTNATSSSTKKSVCKSKTKTKTSTALPYSSTSMSSNGTISTSSASYSNSSSTLSSSYSATGSASGSASFTPTSSGSVPTSSGTGSGYPTSSISASGSVSGTASGSSSTSVSVTKYTTSTVYQTTSYTITSCAATVTNCPVGSVTTETIVDYTTVCPVTETETGKGYPTTTSASSYPTGSGPGSSSASVTEYTTSTVYRTNTYTITSCAATVTNCPAHLGSVTTEVVIDYTTVCPVTATETSPASSSSSPAASGAIPGKGGNGGNTYTPIPSSEGAGKTTTLSSTTTSYVTVKYVSSTATVVSVPTSSVISASASGSASGSMSVVTAISTVEVMPYPTSALGHAGPSLSSVGLVGTGTGVPGVGKGVSSTSLAVTGSATSPPVFTGAAGSLSVRGWSAMVGVVVAGLIVVS